jgi:hypothetical protein
VVAPTHAAQKEAIVSNPETAELGSPKDNPALVRRDGRIVEL